MRGYNPKNSQLLTDVPGLTIDRAFLAHFQVSAARATAADTDGIHAAITLADGATTKVTTGITQPGVTRCLSVTGNAATAVGDVVIKGTDMAGNAITETIVSTGAATVLGAKAFATVTEITVPAQGAADDTIAIGFGEKLGLPHKLAHDTVIAAYLNNALEGTAPTVAVSATDLASNTIDLATALSGKVVDVYYLI